MTRHAQESGRPKSVIAREWIQDRLDREEVDEQIRRAAALHAAVARSNSREAAVAASGAFARLLDDEDGGYDWGQDGPPPVR